MRFRRPQHLLCLGWTTRPPCRPRPLPFCSFPCPCVHQKMHLCKRSMQMQLYQTPVSSAAQVQHRAITVPAHRSAPARMSSMRKLVPPVNLWECCPNVHSNQVQHQSRLAKQRVGDPLPQISELPQLRSAARQGREEVLEVARGERCLACCWCPAARRCTAASRSMERTSRQMRSSWMQLLCSVLSWQACPHGQFIINVILRPNPSTCIWYMHLWKPSSLIQGRQA